MKRKTFIAAHFAWSPQPQQAYGISAGQMHPIGWYLSLLSNMNFKGVTTKLVCNGNGFMDTELPFYSGNSSTTRVSVTAGMVGKILDPWAIYAGAGFGYRALFWETKDNQWIKNRDYSTMGIDVEGGFLFDIKGCLISAGVVTTNFKRFDLKVGIGVAFRKK
jgi:hypothetical protein